MKYTLIKSTALKTLLFGFIILVVFGSCKKEANNSPFSGGTDVASMVVGTYIGSGTNPSGSFVGQTIQISKVSNSRIRIESLNGNAISAFEVDIVKIMNSVTNNPNIDDPSLAIQLSQAATIGFSMESPVEQEFGGIKQ